MASKLLKQAETSLTGKLYDPYQRDGVKWMLERELAKVNPGGVNADEVGLGKTIMTTATLLGNPLEKTLILAPKSLIPQWENEMKKFAPHLKPRINRLPSDTTGNILVIASHQQIVKRNSKSVSASIYHEIEWDRIIIDEAHVIKNKNAKINKCARALKTKIRWCLTATPIMNKMDEFINIMGYLGIDKDQCKQTKQQIVEMYIMRRTKEDIAKVDKRFELPPCEVTIKEVELGTEEERELYQSTWETARAEIKEMKNSEMQNNALEALERLLRMRQICIHPQIYNTGIARKRKLKEVDQWNHSCSKLEALIELLNSQEEGQKSLVFCQFIEEMQLYAERMREEGYNVIRLDGSLDLDERNRLVKKFNEDASVDVFIIQVNTGGVGYNLQAATRVYINTPTWNPALEYQAIGRAHRTGQTKPVKVTKLITVDPSSNVPTVEEFILQLHDTKLKLIADVLNDARIAKVEKGARMRKINEVITFKDISRMFKV